MRFLSNSLVISLCARESGKVGKQGATSRRSRSAFFVFPVPLCLRELPFSTVTSRRHYVCGKQTPYDYNLRYLRKLLLIERRCSLYESRFLSSPTLQSPIISHASRCGTCKNTVSRDARFPYTRARILETKRIKSAYFPFYLVSLNSIRHRLNRIPASNGNQSNGASSPSTRVTP